MSGISAEPQGKITSFTRLRAWKEAHTLALLIHKNTKPFQREDWYLRDQLRRAATSITSNIAEGFSRQSSKDKLRFYYMALSSLTETQNQILFARDTMIISYDQFDEISRQSIIVSKITNGLIKSTKTLYS